MEHAIAYSCSSTPFTPVQGEEGEQLFEKELIYVGNFVKHQPGKETLKFSVDEATLLHWQRTFEDMVAAGHDVPMPLEHTDDPEKRRATILKLSVRENSKGKKALFGIIKFRDDEAKKLAATTNVSIYVPSEFVDGSGKRFVRPIRHVAFTDYPVIPGLGPFQAIAASFEGEKKKMSLASLAEKIGITVADKEEVAIEAEILKRFEDLTRELEDAKKSAAEEEDPEEEIAAGFVNMQKENRENKIANLVREGRITPKVADELKKTFCNEKACALALSSKSTDDNFDATITALQMQEPVIKLHERSGGQAVPLSHTRLDPKDNALIRNAEERAAQARR